MQPILHLSIPVTNLADARAFYVDVLGCAPGRLREEWADVWFYGMQITLHEQPAEVLPFDAHGVRHFGVTLDPDALDSVLARLTDQRVEWSSEPTTDLTGALDGKTSAKVFDPSGNVIEFKTYGDRPPPESG